MISAREESQVALAHSDAVKKTKVVEKQRKELLALGHTRKTQKGSIGRESFGRIDLTEQTPGV